MCVWIYLIFRPRNNRPLVPLFYEKQGFLEIYVYSVQAKSPGTLLGSALGVSTFKESLAPDEPGLQLTVQSNVILCHTDRLLQ